MKNLKRIALVAMVALLGCGAANAQIRFGIKAGTNVEKMHVEKGALKLDNKCGFTGGVMVEGMIPGVGLGLDISAMYTYLNVDNESLEGGDFSKNFIEIPVNLKYKLSIPVVASIIKPYVFTGPSFAFKLDKNTIDAFKEKKCQVVWNLGLGVELIKHLQIGASYGWNINGAGSYLLQQTGVQVTETKVKATNDYWTITAAWLF